MSKLIPVFLQGRTEILASKAVPLPKYKCHKEVNALKIAALSFMPSGDVIITPEDQTYQPFTVESRFVPLHDPARPKPGWYFVIYELGYQSFSPPEPFETGYTRID